MIAQASGQSTESDETYHYVCRISDFDKNMRGMLFWHNNKAASTNVKVRTVGTFLMDMSMTVDDTTEAYKTIPSDAGVTKITTSVVRSLPALAANRMNQDTTRLRELDELVKGVSRSRLPVTEVHIM